jgi:hypothetical protein
VPGIHSITYVPQCFSETISESRLKFLLHEKNFFLKTFFSSQNSFVCASIYKEYPFTSFPLDGAIISVEGIIYNKPDSEVRNQLGIIAKKIRENQSTKEDIARFKDTSDGDFIVHIWDPIAQKGVIFNDYYNRLCGYYYYDSSMLIFSKELKVILEFIPKILFDKNSLVQYLLREYSLGNATLFQNVKHLGLGEVIEFCLTKGSVKTNIIVTNLVTFKLTNPFKNKEEAAKDLGVKFLEATRNRVNKLKEYGYDLMADLSGGFDTRTILAGLSRYAPNVSYYTFEYIHDESTYARAVFDATGKPGTYNKVSFNNLIDPTQISKLIYQTDGLVNYYTTAICYNDIKFLKKQVSKKSARFSGLGGEFIRHPYKNYFHSLFFGFKQNLYNVKMDAQTACDLLNFPKQNFYEYLKKYLCSYAENTKKDKLKHLYYEYYDQYVGIAAEDRERTHIWTVQPLWSKFLLDTIYTRFPLSWASFEFHLLFLKHLNPKLSELNFFNLPMDPKSPLSVKIFDIKYRFKKSVFRTFAKNFVNRKIPFVKYVYHKIKQKKEAGEPGTDFLNEINNLYGKIQKNKKLLNANVFAEFIKAPTTVKQRIITLLKYIIEIEKRYPNKL